MSQLKLIRESTTSVFHLKVYEGYGYEIEIRRYRGEGGGLIINTTPIGDMLYQPDLYVSENLEVTISFNSIIHADIKKADRIIKAINDVIALTEELQSRIEEL